VKQVPSREEGYARVLMAGTTGAGKTTFLRHAIGSSHERDRFPSTSTARTTIADIEIITADGRYKAAVTFMSEFEVRAHIDECIEAACLAAVEGYADAKVAAALLMHREQRFRLSYVLGELPGEDTPDQEDFSFEPAAAADLDEREVVSEADRKLQIASTHHENTEFDHCFSPKGAFSI
jgi:GTPase SAR1 family protein